MIEFAIVLVIRRIIRDQESIENVTVERKTDIKYCKGCLYAGENIRSDKDDIGNPSTQNCSERVVNTSKEQRWKTTDLIDFISFVVFFFSYTTFNCLYIVM